MAPSAIKGDRQTLRVGIYNDKPFPLSMVRALVQTPDPKQIAELNFSLDPGVQIYYDIPMQCVWRGAYDVGITTIEVSDIFGLLRIRFDLRRLPYYKQPQLIVYPRLVHIPYLTSAMRGAKYEGGGAHQVTEDGESFSDTRQYRFGDPFKRVHRKLSARKRQLFVKRYDLPMESTAIVAVNSREDHLSGEDALRQADISCECAAAIAHYCLRIGYVVDLIGADEYDPIVEGKGIRDFSRIYDSLAVMKFIPSGNIAANLSANMRRHPNLKAVYVISSEYDQDLSDLLAVLAQSGCYVKLLSPVFGGKEKADIKPILGVNISAVASADELIATLDDHY